MKNFIQSKLTLAVLLIAFASTAIAPLLPAPSVYAKECAAGTSALTLLPPWYKGLQCDDDKGSILPPKDQGGLQPMIFIIILNVIEALLYIVGYITLAMIIWGGFKYMLGGDNPSKVEAAKKTIVNAIIGLVISIFSIIIINVIGGAF